MMLHRHFENKEKNENVTTLSDVTPKVKVPEKVAESEEMSKKRGRKSKTTE